MTTTEPHPLNHESAKIWVGLDTLQVQQLSGSTTTGGHQVNLFIFPNPDVVPNPTLTTVLVGHVLYVIPHFDGK
jgi:hypothetical protein